MKTFPVTHYRTATVDGIKIFYCEAGPKDAPVILLLHGFPTSSHMFRNLIPASRIAIARAPDYPGYSQRHADRAKFKYTFDRFGELVGGLLDQLGVARYAMYVMDYGAPVGWRLALKHPERITGLIVQNGNAYDEGLKEFWDPIKAYWADHSEAHRKASMCSSPRRRQNFSTPTGCPTSAGSRPTTGCTTSVARPSRQRRNPDGPVLRLPHQPSAVPGGAGLLPQTQATDADRVGQKRLDFPADGAHPYKRDLPEVEFHLINSGHFALEERPTSGAADPRLLDARAPRPVRRILWKEL